MPVGEEIVGGFLRLVVELLFEGVAYGTGYVILYPFTFGKVKKRFSKTTISLVGISFWVVLIVLLLWQPRGPEESA